MCTGVVVLSLLYIQTINSVSIYPLTSTQNLSKSYGSNGLSWSLSDESFCTITEYMDEIANSSYFMVDGYFKYQVPVLQDMNSSINSNILNEYAQLYNNSNNKIVNQLPFYIDNFGTNVNTESRTPSSCTHKPTGNVFIAYPVGYLRTQLGTNVIGYKIFINTGNDAYWTQIAHIPSVNYSNTSNSYQLVYNVMCLNDGYLIAWVEQQTHVYYKIINLNGTSEIIKNETMWINPNSSYYGYGYLTVPFLIQSTFVDNTYLFGWSYSFVFTMSFNYNPTAHKFTTINVNPVKIYNAILGGAFKWKSFSVNATCCYIIVLNDEDHYYNDFIEYIDIYLIDMYGLIVDNTSIYPATWISVTVIPLNTVFDLPYFMVTYNASSKLMANVYFMNESYKINMVNSTILSDVYPYGPFGVCNKLINDNLLLVWSDTMLLHGGWETYGIYTRSFRIGN